MSSGYVGMYGDAQPASGGGGGVLRGGKVLSAWSVHVPVGVSGGRACVL